MTSPSSKQAVLNEACPSASMTAFLAEAVHAIYVVSLTQHAQRGVLHYSLQNSPLVAHSPDSSTPSIEAKSVTPAAILHISSRWLDGVSRILNQPFTLDDLSRVTVVFPQWVAVKWTVSPNAYQQSPLSTTLARSERGADPSLAGSSPIPYGALQARIYLYSAVVISVEDAQKAVTSFFSSSSRSYPESSSSPLHMTAYKAWRESLSSPSEAIKAVPASLTSTKDAQLGRPFKRQRSEALGKKLRSMISSELKESLSEEKLDLLLAQLEKDLNHEEEKKYMQIEKQRLLEQLVETYEHIHSIFGMQRVAMSLPTLLKHLKREGSAIQHQDLLLEVLQHLAGIPASGLSLCHINSVVTAQGSSSESASEAKSVENTVVQLDRTKVAVKEVVIAVKKVQALVCGTKKES